MKWFRNKQYMKESLEQYKKQNRKSNLMKDHINLLQDHLDLLDENEKFEKALELACKMLDYDCPVSQELIDDLDCEMCCDNYEECWKKYFLNKVEE